MRYLAILVVLIALVMACATSATAAIGDTQPPATTITAGPAEGSTLSVGETAFSFTGMDNHAVAYFEVKNVKDGVYQPFVRSTSPKAYSSLTDGTYAFKVRAVDGAGNVDPTPALRKFAVNIPPPDADSDGVADAVDNCPTTANPDQADLDNDGLGNVCDADRDGDGTPNDTDYAPADPAVQHAPAATSPFPGIRYYPMIGNYASTNSAGFADEDSLISDQYATYVGPTNEKAYLDLDTTDNDRYWYCGGRKYDWKDFLVNPGTEPTHTQASDPYWSGYKWNTTDSATSSTDNAKGDNIEEMLDASPEVAANKAKACIFVAVTATAEADAVPSFMLNHAGYTWHSGSGDHVRIDNSGARQQVSDFLVALTKHYGGDPRIGQIVVGEYYPQTGDPLTAAQTTTYRNNMETVWSDMIAAAPLDSNRERVNILQSNIITTGGDTTLPEIRNIGIGLSGSDPNIFEGGMTENNLKALYGGVPCQHQVNAGRLLDGYQANWPTIPNPFGFSAGNHTVRFEHLTWYHGSKGPVPLDSIMMKTNPSLVSQWHEGMNQNGPNGSYTGTWGKVPAIPPGR